MGIDKTLRAETNVREITRADWEAYRDYLKGLRDPHHFKGFLQGKNLDAEETYSFLPDKSIQPPTFVMLGLWDQHKLVGQIAIDYIVGAKGEKIADIEGIEIADAYRGQWLTNRFRAGCLKHLRDTGFNGAIKTTIKPENITSLTIAKRYGFEDTGAFNQYGYHILVLPAHRDSATPDNTSSAVPSPQGVDTLYATQRAMINRANPVEALRINTPSQSVAPSSGAQRVTKLKPT